MRFVSLLILATFTLPGCSESDSDSGSDAGRETSNEDAGPGDPPPASDSGDSAQHGDAGGAKHDGGAAADASADAAVRDSGAEQFADAASDASVGMSASDDGGPADSGSAVDSGDSAVVSPYAVFEDPSSDFQTTRVYDSNREVVQFHIENMTIERELDGVAALTWVANGNALIANGNRNVFQIAFGSEGGEQRAYFTEVSTGTICDLEFQGENRLAIYPTSEPPPQE